MKTIDQIFEAWEDAVTVNITQNSQSDSLAVGMLTGRALRQQMVLLLRTLSDPAKLKVMYGLTVETSGSGSLQTLDDLARDMKHVSEYLYEVDTRYFSWDDWGRFDDSRASHLNYLKTLRYIPSGTDRDLDDLICRLDEFNRNLQVLIPLATSREMDRRLFGLAVKDAGKNPDRTKRL